MAAIGGGSHEMLAKRAEKSVQDTIDRLRREVAEKAHQVQLPGYARKEAERIDRKLFHGSKFPLGPPRFHPDMQEFLPIMLLDAACDHQRLRDKLEEYARYLVSDYPWNWCTAPVTSPLRMQARDLLLREGESDFGETPLAGPIAFIRYHYRMLKLDTLTDFGLLYNRAYTLEMAGYFKNSDVERTSYFEEFKEHGEEDQGKGQIEFIVPRGHKRGREDAPLAADAASSGPEVPSSETA
jgi:hypothetical protein